MRRLLGEGRRRERVLVLRETSWKTMQVREGRVVLFIGMIYDG